MNLLKSSVMNTKFTLIAIIAFSFLPALSQNRELAGAPLAPGNATARSFNRESVAAPDQVAGISITPNPSEGRFLIIVPDAGEMKVSVYNVLGDLVYKARSSAASNGNMLVDISQRQAGVYLVKIETDSETMSRKIVVR
jgi:hypothetical protein